jgi:hypothetical protein
VPVPSNDDTNTPSTRNGCICAGAVLEDSVLQHFEFAGCMSFALPTTTLDAVAADFSPRAVNSLTLLPDNDTNQGRAMRCLMSSYLC